MGAKLTTEEFIKRSKERFGDTLDYSETKYTHINNKIILICLRHGKFEDTPFYHFIKKYACVKCAKEASKSNTDDFIKKSKEKFGDFLNYSKVNYITSKIEVILICPKHNEFKIKPEQHLRKIYACSKCAKEASGNKTRSNIEDFIKRSRNKFGNFLDYSKAKYININSNIILICPKHGEFNVSVKSHFQAKYPCSECSYDIKRNNHEDFIKKSKEKFGEYLDYSKVNYVDNKTPITLICPFHKEFDIIPSSHLNSNKYACIKCGNNSLSHEQFIIKANEKHHNKYDYSKINYVSCISKIEIICPDHGSFFQIPSSHLRGNGCMKCRRIAYRTSIDEFIKKAKIIHNDKYNYELCNFTILENKISIICNKHGIFKQRASNHLKGAGCALCGSVIAGIKISLTKEEFINRCNLIHNKKYDYSMVNYKSVTNSVNIICNKHGVFSQNANNHLQGSGCPSCAHRNSKGEIAWLDTLQIPNDSIHRDVLIKFGERKVYVDGFDPETKTVYEFNGDYWHGNPELYNANDINKDTKTTFGELYDNTMKRQKLLEDHGYKVISIWEADWKKSVLCLK